MGLLVIRRLRDRSSPGRRDYSPRAGSASFQEAPVDTAGHLTRCAGAPTEYPDRTPRMGAAWGSGPLLRVRVALDGGGVRVVDPIVARRSRRSTTPARWFGRGPAAADNQDSNARSTARGRRRNHAARGDPVQSALRTLTPGCRRPGEGLVGGSSGMPPRAPIDAHDAFSECNGVNELYRVIINCSDLEGAGGTGSLARAWCAARDSNPEPADEESADPTQLHCQPWQC